MSSPRDGFVHLHNHTEYSMLDGAARIKDMFSTAQEMGMPAIAMTDQHDVVAECGLALATAELMARAQAQGRMRADATQADVELMMAGCGSVMRSNASPDAWRRYLTLMIDGLRAA